MAPTKVFPGAPKIGAKQITLLKKLSNACGISGDEGEVRQIILDEIKGIADEVKVDALGNVLAIRKAKSADPLRVMLAAHMDEVGLILVDDEKDGIYRFSVVGGIDPRQLAGKPVWVGHQHVPGVIGTCPIHLIDKEEMNQTLPVKSLRIDVGLQGGAKVKLGDGAVFATKFRQVGPSLVGKALDDRLGVATLIELLKNPPDNVELLAAFSVQEEIGGRGARVAAYAFNPDLAIALDSTPSYDLPVWDDSENVRYNTRLDAGPAVYVADTATISNPQWLDFVLETARLHKLPHQIRQPGGGGTDAGAIHRQRGGIPSVSISVPGRYAHTAAQISRLSDWQNYASLVYAVLKRLDKNTFTISK